MRKILLISFILFLSCTEQKNPSLLRIALDKEPPSLDWQKTTDTTSRIVVLNIMEPLLDYDFSGKHITLKPALVTNWQQIETTKWQIVLKKGVLWSDGKEFTAQDVIDSFERLLLPSTAAFNAYLFYDIKNAKSYNKGKISDFKKVGVEKISKYKVHFILENENSYFPKLLALMSVMPIRKDIIKKYGDDWTKPENFVGLGPYLLNKREYQDSIRIIRNEKYYAKAPKIKQIEFKVITEVTTAMNLFEAKKLDALNKVPEAMIPKLKGNKNFRQIKDYSIEYLGFNLKEKPYNLLSFRKALALAIDRKEIKKIFQSDVFINQNIIPFGIRGHSDVGLTFDAKRAKELLGDKKYPPLKLSFYTDEKQRKLGENLQKQFQRNLGLNFELEMQEWKVYLAKVNSNPPGFFRIGWIAIYPDPSLFLGLFTSDSHFNTSGWSNKDYDQLVEKLKSEKNPDKRKLYAKEASEILLKEDVVVIPLYTGSRQYYLAEGLKNYPLNGMNRLRFHKTYWSK